MSKNNYKKNPCERFRTLSRNWLQLHNLNNIKNFVVVSNRGGKPTKFSLCNKFSYDPAQSEVIREMFAMDAGTMSLHSNRSGICATSYTRWKSRCNCFRGGLTDFICSNIFFTDGSNQVQ